MRFMEYKIINEESNKIHLNWNYISFNLCIILLHIRHHRRRILNMLVFHCTNDILLDILILQCIRDQMPLLH